MVFWTAINLFTFHKNPKWVPYPGNFRSWYTGFGAQWKRRQKIEQCFGEIYWQLDILNVYLWVKYSMAKEKNGDFMKTIQQLPKPWCTFLLNMWQVTVQNNCGPVYTWFRIIDFNLPIIHTFSLLFSIFNTDFENSNDTGELSTNMATSYKFFEGLIHWLYSMLYRYFKSYFENMQICLL